MKRSDLTEKLLDIKREKEWSWKHICEKIGGYSEVLIVGAILGQMKLTKPQAANAAELFGLTKSEAACRVEIPPRIASMARNSGAAMTTPTSWPRMRSLRPPLLPRSSCENRDATARVPMQG